MVAYLQRNEAGLPHLTRARTICGVALSLNGLSSAISPPSTGGQTSMHMAPTLGGHWVQTNAHVMLALCGPI
jgi:hypothetical protein